eukprot:GILJ01002579.1.p1 GENE.GILJ01002579.1~~GILJ01002579.1.p1  ORF type:complete len:164 (-),score=10.68 GILJ01002579.1:202-648(-)
MARRLAKELSEISAAPLDFAQVALVGEDMFHWHATVQGPLDSPYAGGIFHLDLAIPQQYPFKPPVVKFRTKIFHPNVRNDDGSICADALGDNWGPTLSIKYVLQAIYEILREPHGDTPLDAEIGALFKTDRAQFDRKAREMTRTHASS